MTSFVYLIYLVSQDVLCVYSFNKFLFQYYTVFFIFSSYGANGFNPQQYNIYFQNGAYLGFFKTFKYRNIGGSVKTSSKSLFISNISQCLFIAFFMSGIVWLYVKIIDFCLILRDFPDKAVVFFQRRLSVKLPINPIFLLCGTCTFFNRKTCETRCCV